MSALVGNDVVDLGDPAVADSHLRTRFLERVCHESERAMLETARDPKVLLWSLFAAKEAAFKAVSRAGPPLVFAHRRFVVAPDLRSVRYEASAGDVVLRLSVEVQGGCVHAVAWSGDVAPRWSVGEAGGEDPSVAVRRLLSGVLGVETVREPRPGSWDGFGPPRVLRDGAPLELEVSLSHDGRYVAFAAA